jgi:hypothetical protein
MKCRQSRKLELTGEAACFSFHHSQSHYAMPAASLVAAGLLNGWCDESNTEPYKNASQTACLLVKRDTTAPR